MDLPYKAWINKSGYLGQTTVYQEPNKTYKDYAPVKIRGRWVPGANPPEVGLTVQDKGGAELLSQTVDLKVFFSEGSTISVPFIAFGTGCSEIRLTATLIGGRETRQSKISKKVPFACGE